MNSIEQEDSSRGGSALSEGLGVLPESYPPPHARYLLERDGVTFTATPCYGMHEPWWVVKTLTGEAEPERMQAGDKWRPA